MSQATAQAKSKKVSYDTQDLNIEVALPPAGQTSVRLEIRQLLRRRNGLVNFMVPHLRPSVPVFQVVSTMHYVRRRLCLI